MAIGMVFVLAALAVLFPMLAHIAHDSGQAIAAVAAAKQARAVADAAQTYVFSNAASVQSAVTSQGKLVLCVPSTPGTCPAGEPDLTNGYLPQGFRPVNPYQQSWSVTIGKDGNGNLQALIESAGGVPIDGTHASMIASEVGAIGGVVGGGAGNLAVPGCGANQACGTYAGWGPIAIGGAVYPNPGPGHVVALLDFNGAGTALNSNYLYRVPVPGHPELNAMQTDLSMTDTSGTAHNITGANQISTQSLVALSNGGLGTPSVSMANGRVVTWNQVPEGGVLQLQGANGVNIFLESLNGTFRLVNNPWNAQLFSVDQNGNVAAAGSITTPSTVQGGYVNSTGNVNAQNALTAGGGFTAQSNGYTTVADTLTAGSRVVLGTGFGSANQGWGCGPNGEIAANANGSGQLMSCVNGAWQATGSGLTNTYSGGGGTWNTDTGWIANTSGYVEFITAQGGAQNATCGNNNWQLSGWVNGSQVIDVADNNQTAAKDGSIYFFVNPGSSWRVTSNPYNCWGGQFSASVLVMG